MKKTRSPLDRPIVVFGPMNSGTSLITALIHIGGAWIGITKEAKWRNPLGFFENKVLEKAIYRARKSGESMKRAILMEIKRQGYCGGLWCVKQFHNQLQPWLDNFNSFWVFVHRDFESICKSRYKDPRDQPITSEKEQKVKSLINDFEKARKSIINNTDTYFDIWPNKIINGDYEELKQLYNKTRLIFYPALVKHFIVQDFWHYREDDNNEEC